MVMVAERPKVLLGDKTEAYGADPSNPKHYEFRYKVIELSALITSHDDNLMPNPKYPKELQPRLRDRAASQVQIGSMAKNLNPRVLLHDSGFLDTGPMIVGSDDVLESGNGRVMALRLAATEHRDKYNLYVDMLKANARGYGLEPRAISEMKHPVLVRERLTPVDRVSFAADANVGAVMRMSPYEQALQDSGRLSDHVIGNLEVGEEQSIEQALRSPKNRTIIQHFVGTLPANERASISESGGDINQQGLDRLKLAIFAKTYTGKAGQRLVRIFGENVDPVIKGIENATFQSLPDMAKAESLIGAGHRDKKLSIAEDLAEVIDTYASLKQQNLKTSDYLAQSAMFEERLNPFQKNLLQHVDDIGRKPKYVRELLRDTAQRIIESPPPGQASFMGIESQTKEGIANVIVAKQRQELGLPEIKPTPSAATGKRLEESHEGRTKGAERVRAEARQESKETNPLPKAESQSARPEPDLATTSAMQAGLAGMGKETAQIEMLAEFGGAGGGGKKETMVDVAAEKARLAAKPLPGQLTMKEKTALSKEEGEMAEDIRILTKGSKSAILTQEEAEREYEREQKRNQSAGDSGLRSAHPTGTRSESPQVLQGVQAEKLQGNEEQQRTERGLPTEGEGNQEIRPEPHGERRMGNRGVESSHTHEDTGERQRLTPPEVLSGSLPTSLPRDIILNSASDIGATAGAASRFDANLDALRTLKVLDAEKRRANPQEQAKLAKYSGFGDSAFNGAFETHRRADDIWKSRGNQLRELTTEDEYRALERSRLNAFYTSPEVINATWKALQQLGAGNLKHPRVLEPSAGSGRFLGFQPTELAARSDRIAVELDQMTAKILKYCYPQTEVYAMGYEKAPIGKESIDIAISNVPFGDYPIHDPSFTKARKRLTRQIHNYFFAKTLEQLRPGGVLAFVTSHNTLDAPTAKPIREALAEQADLVGAIRLPKTAFPDTEVCTDIIFMRKRIPGETPSNADWVNSDAIELPVKEETYRHNVKVNINRYFLEHPEMVLGEHSATGSMYGGNEYTVVAKHGQSLESALNSSVDRMPQNVLKDDAPATSTSPRYIAGMPSAINAHEGSRIIGDDGQTIYVKRQGALVKANMTAEEQARVKDMLAVRDAARSSLDTQLREAENMEIAKSQERLKLAYDSFVTTYGPLNATRNADLMRDDPDGALLRALEKWNAEKPRELEKITPEQANAREFKSSTSLTPEQANRLKMPIFTQRVVKGMGERAINTESDAEAVSLNETGRLDFKRMGELLGKSEAEVRDSLAAKRQIFKNPIGDWEPDDKYLSGDVREKLRTAEAAASANPHYRANVEALKSVQPPDLTPGQIGISLGMPWIPQNDVNDFTKELLKVNYMRGDQQPFEYIEKTGEWIKGTEGQLQAPHAKLTSEWGTERMPANEIIYRILNSKMVEVVDKFEGEYGKEIKVRNPVETIAAQEKAAAIEARFREWLWEDTGRTTRLCELYNNTFNTIRPRRFDGNHQALPAMSTKWAKQIHPHQKDAIWRVVQDRTALLAHEVGFGKTAVMVGAGMELRRLGLSQKNMYVVPKATHEQFYNQFRDVYPYAKILYPEDADFTPERRSEFISRVATGDWDAVLLSDTQFSRIPVKPETEAKFLKEEIDDFREALEAEEETGDDSRYGRKKKESKTHKELQKALVRMEERLKETLGRIGEKQEQTMHFEDLGVDQLFVDEADMYKNLHFATRMSRIKGLPNGKSDRAFDMYEKCRVLQEQGGGQGVVFATGTPVANTIAEMYTMMRYLQKPMLEAKGLHHFDAWAKTFGETTEALEQNAAGQYKLTQRFSKFVNTPELSNMWQQVADIRVADESPTVVAQRPRLVDEQGKARRTVVSCPPDASLLNYMKLLEERADTMPNDPRIDNMLKLASDARKASLDMRMVEPNAPFNPEGKVGKAAQKIAEIYKATTDKKGTQLVFLDLGTPKAKEKVDATETEASDEEGEETAEERRLLQNVYRVLKERIVASGIPEKEIAFIHEAKTNKQKERLFERVNSGDVRVIIGSTSKLGTGVNVQERAAALHHLDAPWRPRDIEQREGRIIRQGNKAYGPKMDEDRKVIDAGPGVRVYTYVTERSFDAFMWQAIEAKSRAIKSIMRRENPPRAVEDIDSFTMSAGEAKAIASGNPDIMKAVTLKNDITKLQMLRGSHTDARARARGQLGQLPKEINEVQSTIAKLEKDAALSKVEAPFAIKVGDQPFAERPAAGEALKGIIASAPETTDAARALQIARYKGFDVKVLNQGPGAGYQLLITNPATGYTHATTVIPYSELTGGGALQRIENKVANIPTAVGAAQKRLEQAQENLKTYQAQGEKPFEYQERLDKLSKQLGILERKLQGQEIKSEELATVEDIITPPEGIPEPSPVYRWGEAQPEQAAEEARELVKVEKEALKEIVKPDIATPNVNPAAEAQKPPVEKKIEVEELPTRIEKPIEKAHPTPYAPPGERWTVDVGVMPGEMMYFLDGFDNPKAGIRELVNDAGDVLYEVITSEDKKLGIYNTLDKAAKKAEAEFPATGKPKPEKVKSTPTIKQPYRVQVQREGKTILEPIKGKAVILDGGVEAFVHRPPKGERIVGWVVSEKETGMSISRSRHTQEDAIRQANEALEHVTRQQGVTPQEAVRLAREKARVAHPELYGEPPEAKTEVVEVPIAIEKPEVIEVPVAIAAPKVEEVKPTPATKEPWQMSREEWRKIVRLGQDFKQIGVNPTPLSTLRGAKDFGELDRRALASHEGQTISAFASGKPVPAEVLKDYPELKAPTPKVKQEEPQDFAASFRRFTPKQARQAAARHDKEAAQSVAEHKEASRLVSVREAYARSVKQEEAAKRVLAQGTLKGEPLTKSQTKEISEIQADAERTQRRILSKNPQIARGETKAEVAITPQPETKVEVPKSFVLPPIEGSPGLEEPTVKVPQVLRPQEGVPKKYETPTKQARKPRIKAAKAEPTERKEPTTYVVSLDDTRSPHAVAVDRGILAKDVVTKRNKAGVSRWRHKPNQMDVRGVDTPRARKQAHGPGIMDSRGRIHKQKRGTVV